MYGSTSNEPNVERLRSLAAFDHVDSYALAFREAPIRPVGEQSAFIGGLAAACAGTHAALLGGPR